MRDEAASPDHHRRASMIIAALIGVAAVVGAVAGAVVGALAGSWWIGLVIGAALGAASALLVQRGAARRLLGATGARPLSEGELPRLGNMVEGLCTTMGVSRPSLWCVDDPSANAFTLAGTDGAMLGVTSGLVEVLGVVELEGVLAAQLSQIRSGATELATVASGLLGGGTAGVFAGLARRMMPPERELAADRAACLVTRYPPGLASALEKMLARDPGPAAAAPTTDALWTLAPRRDQGRGHGSTPSTHADTDVRLHALRDL